MFSTDWQYFLSFLKSFLDPWLWPEGSCELGSVLPFAFSSFHSFRPSVLLSESFLGIGSLDFSENEHGIRGLCVVVHDRAGFF